MVVRRRKKKNKLRGNRTFGQGNTKRRRGSGSRGGTGRAGSHKHKFSKYYVDFGVKRKLKAKEKGEAINLGQLNELLPRFLVEQKAEKKGNMIVVDGKKMGIAKLLGAGKIEEKVLVRNVSLSGRAKEKIEAAGGKIEVTEGAGEKGEKSEGKINAAREEE